MKPDDYLLTTSSWGALWWQKGNLFQYTLGQILFTLIEIDCFSLRLHYSTTVKHIFHLTARHANMSLKYTSRNSPHTGQFSSKSRESDSTLKNISFAVGACEEGSWSRNLFLHEFVPLVTARNLKCCPLLVFVRCHTAVTLLRAAGRLGTYLWLVIKA